MVEVPYTTQVKSGKELVIPLSLKNLKMLCSCPLKGRENRPVFSEHCSNMVFNECGASSDKVSVYFMRRCIAEGSRGLTFAEQKKLVRGFNIASRLPGITPLRIRALFDAIVILESGACPDTRGLEWNVARCPDFVNVGNQRYQAGIGTFAPGEGVCVFSGNYLGFCYGVVPGVQAEVFERAHFIDYV